jgi:hypothetical protein
MDAQPCGHCREWQARESLAVASCLTHLWRLCQQKQNAGCAPGGTTKQKAYWWYLGELDDADYIQNK